MGRGLALLLFFAAFLLITLPAVQAHGVANKDQAFIEQNPGTQIVPFLYLGAKHMVTGYDHLLFLVGVIFFLYHLKEVFTYVSLFTLGHSTTLILGVLLNLRANAYVIDAIIGLSVVYKAFDNLNGFRLFWGWQPNTKAAVGIFGLFHGFGLATKLQKFQMSRDGLLANIVSFNVGVEIGQFLALSFILIGITYWRTTRSFGRHAYATNVGLMLGGFLLMGYQISGYVWGARS